MPHPIGNALIGAITAPSLESAAIAGLVSYQRAPHHSNAYSVAIGAFATFRLITYPPLWCVGLQDESLYPALGILNFFWLSGGGIPERFPTIFHIHQVVLGTFFCQNPTTLEKVYLASLGILARLEQSHKISRKYRLLSFVCLSLLNHYAPQWGASSKTLPLAGLILSIDFWSYFTEVNVKTSYPDIEKLINEHLDRVLNDDALGKHICPISRSATVDPVLDPTDRKTVYERLYILRTLNTDPRSTTTRKPLAKEDLIELPQTRAFIHNRIEQICQNPNGPYPEPNAELLQASEEELVKSI